MPRSRSLVINSTVTQAMRLTTCRTCGTASIRKGDHRFTIKQGRDVKHYCLPCALRFVEASKLKLDLMEVQIIEAMLKHSQLTLMTDDVVDTVNSTQLGQVA